MRRPCWAHAAVVDAAIVAVVRLVGNSHRCGGMGAALLDDDSAELSKCLPLPPTPFETGGGRSMRSGEMSAFSELLKIFEKDDSPNWFGRIPTERTLAKTTHESIKPPTMNNRATPAIKKRTMPKSNDPKRQQQRRSRARFCTRKGMGSCRRGRRGRGTAAGGCGGGGTTTFLCICWATESVAPRPSTGGAAFAAPVALDSRGNSAAPPSSSSSSAAAATARTALCPFLWGEKGDAVPRLCAGEGAPEAYEEVVASLSEEKSLAGLY